MYHFFVEPEQIQQQDKIVKIIGKDVNHIKNVLRMQPGEELDVSNGIEDGDYRCAIKSYDNDYVICDLLFYKENNVELPAKIYLFQGLPKADKMELIIQKAVELGAYEIIPVATARAVMKIDPKKERSKIERWNAIAEAAAKQSKRSIIPMITNVMTMKEALKKASEMDIKLIPYELAEGMQKTKAFIDSVKPGATIAIFIGPEGGFSTEEVAAAQKVGVEPITLGKRILRTETAGFTILSWLMYHLEE